MNPKLGGMVFYAGRFLQAFAMWILLMDIFMAFLAGWFMVRQTARK
jgi:hypothetical protein